MSTARDPLTNPAVDDVFSTGFETFTITKVDAAHVHYRAESKRPKTALDRIPMYCKKLRRLWPKFMAELKCEVIHAA